MPSHTIKVTGVSTELLHLLDERIRERHSACRAEYIRELIRKDLLEMGKTPQRRTFREIVTPLHDSAPADETDEESDQFVDELISKTRRDRQNGEKRGAA